MISCREHVRRAIAIATLGLLALVASAGIALAQDIDATLAEAIEVYAAALETEERETRLERFRRAERLFSTVAAASNPTADLYANLGNAALQAEHIGVAVLSYRRALLLDPDHARASENLDHVRRLAPAWLPRPERDPFFDSFFGWHRRVAPSERSLATAIAFALASALLATGIMTRRRGLRSAAAFPALVWLVLLGSMAIDPASAAREQGVVVGRELVARAADSVHSPARFSRPLPIGAEVEILETRDDWLRVALANGREGWVRASGVERVAP